MSRVILLNPPGDVIRTGRWVRKSRGAQSWPPIWLAYATALLEREGHECRLVDASVEGLTQTQTHALIDKFNPDLIAYYWAYGTHRSDLAFADRLAAKYPLILVGPWSFCLPDALTFGKHLSIMTYGEFEHTLLELVEGQSQPDGVKGVIYKTVKGDVVKNPPRPLATGRELDRIPFVSKVYARHLDIFKYRQTSLQHPFIDLLSSRGCPFRCSFCLWIRAFQRMDPHRYRQRSIE
ncbi:MAG: hypothetical protein ACTSYX_12685, partial [Candidatus Thorarchaeota archaeon]